MVGLTLDLTNELSGTAKVGIIGMCGLCLIFFFWLSFTIDGLWRLTSPLFGRSLFLMAGLTIDVTNEASGTAKAGIIPIPEG